MTSMLGAVRAPLAVPVVRALPVPPSARRRPTDACRRSLRPAGTMRTSTTTRATASSTLLPVRAARTCSATAAGPSSPAPARTATAASTARPSAMPSWWAVLTRPEAAPASARRDTGDAGVGQRREGEALPGTDQHHRQRHRAQVGVPDAGPAQPDHPDEGDGGAAGEQDAVGDPGAQPRDRHGDGEVDQRHRQEPQAGLQRGEAEGVLQVLGGEEEEPDHRAQVEQAGGVGAAALPAAEQPQRHDRLRDPGLGDHQDHQQHQPDERAATTTRAEPQPVSPDSMIPKTRAAHAERRAQGADDVEAPALPRRLGEHGAGAEIMAIAIGTLTRNAARQEIQSVSAPPTSSPRLAPMPAVAPYQATARLRASPSK